MLVIQVKSYIHNKIRKAIKLLGTRCSCCCCYGGGGGGQLLMGRGVWIVQFEDATAVMALPQYPSPEIQTHGTCMLHTTRSHAVEQNETTGSWFL